MFSIGEFSKLTQLTVKTLRFYHEEGLLTPSYVDPQTGYRYYDRSHIETARIISHLRRLEFSLGDIKQLIQKREDEDILAILERHHQSVKGQIKHLRDASIAIRRVQVLIEDQQGERGMSIP